MRGRDTGRIGKEIYRINLLKLFETTISFVSTKICYDCTRKQHSSTGSLLHCIVP